MWHFVVSGWCTGDTGKWFHGIPGSRPFEHPVRAGIVRAGVITLLGGSIFCLACGGVVMLVRIQRKGRAPGLHGWHRLGAWVLVLPLLALSGSGLYHLWALVLEPPQSFLRHGEPLAVEKLRLPLGEQWTTLRAGLEVNRLSVVRNAQGDVLYRLGLNAQGVAPVDAGEIRKARFSGVPATGPAVYVDASRGEVWEPGDKALALELGDVVTGHPRSALADASLVTRFGVDYDFRNKRVPVWRLIYGEPYNTTYFVDTATGVLVDAVEAHEQPERLSFALLHKWNFLMMLGRNVQNIIISLVVIAAIVFLAIPGLRLRSRRKSPQ